MEAQKELADGIVPSMESEPLSVKNTISVDSVILFFQLNVLSKGLSKDWSEVFKKLILTFPELLYYIKECYANNYYIKDC